VKRHKNLYPEITGFDNLLKASRKARKGKRFTYQTAMFELNLEKELLLLQRELEDQSYRHGTYRDFYVYDPKKRLISAAPFRDRVVHHALCNIIEPFFDKTFIHDSYACRKQKGTHKAIDRYTAFSRKNTYVLKCDIQKYFQSIDHEILIDLLSRKIKCSKTLWLIREIVSTRTDHTQNKFFPGDDLFTPYYRNKGIPIGNLTSQFFANVYLNGFDHFIKQELKCRYYIRYVDDFVVFDNDKQRLQEVKKKMVEYLTGLRLTLHRKKCRTYRVDEGVDFLGFRVFPTHRLLKKQNALHMRRKLKKMAREIRENRISPEKMRQSINSWISHAKHGDTWHLRQKIVPFEIL
jgi:retron-type reverse transcriptase